MGRLGASPALSLLTILAIGLPNPVLQMRKAELVEMMPLAHRHMASQKNEGVGLGGQGELKMPATSGVSVIRQAPGQCLGAGYCAGTWEGAGETGPLSHTLGDRVVMREKQHRAEGGCGRRRLWRRDAASVTGAGGSASHHQEPG